MAGFRAEVPFEIGDCGDGQGFWDRVNDAFRPRRRHLAERLIEPVKRQNTAVRTTSQVVGPDDSGRCMRKAACPRKRGVMTVKDTCSGHKEDVASGLWGVVS